MLKIKGRRLSYFSNDLGCWVHDISRITLGDICALPPLERDQVLLYFRHRQYESETSPVRPLDSAQKSL